MLTTTDTKRIDGRDYHGDRWCAQQFEPLAELEMPALIAIRTMDGSIHLDHHDAQRLAAWLQQTVDAPHQDAGQPCASV